MPETTRPNLTDLILLFVREQYPKAEFTTRKGWGNEVLMNNHLIGTVLHDRWLQWMWKDIPLGSAQYVHKTDIKLLDVVLDSCEACVEYERTHIN